MVEKIYYSKVEFKAVFIWDGMHSSILLNLVERTLVYQLYERKRASVKYVKVMNSKTNFESVLLPDYPKEKVIYSYAHFFSEEEFVELLQLCNALDFEPFRGKKQSMDFSDGFKGYRDGWYVLFTGITDSYLPKLEICMGVKHDDLHTWPSEKLYQYICRTYLLKKEIQKDIEKATKTKSGYYVAV